MLRFVSVVTAALALGVGASALAQNSPEAAVKARQDGMEKLWPGFYRDIAQTVRTDNPDLALVANKATQASEFVSGLASLFPPGTGREAVPSTRAKPEIWTQRADFEASLTALTDTSKALANEAKNGDVTKVKAAWADVAKACGACHGGPEKAGGKFRFEKE